MDQLIDLAVGFFSAVILAITFFKVLSDIGGSIQVGRTPVALSYKDGTFGAVSNLCNHVGGPLGDGKTLQPDAEEIVSLFTQDAWPDP